jgi:hypothetical protein
MGRPRPFLEQVGVLGDERLQRVEPHREHDDIRGLDRLLDGSRGRQGAQLARERGSVRLIPRGQHDRFTAGNQMPRQCAADVPDADDSSSHWLFSIRHANVRDEAVDRGGVGEDPDDTVAAFDLLVDPFQWVC